MPKNDTIFKRLEQATEAERLEICNILGVDEKYINDIDKISAEFRSVSGHTVANTFRDRHSLEYKFILKDTYKGLSETIDKSKKFNSNNASEEELEDKVKFIMESIYQDLKEKDSKIVVEEFRKKLISEGKVWSGIEVVLGGGGASLLAKLATLPIAIGVTVGQAVSTPTYRKTFQVVAKLIQIKKRVEIEEKIKEI